MPAPRFIPVPATDKPGNFRIRDLLLQRDRSGLFATSNSAKVCAGRLNDEQEKTLADRYRAVEGFSRFVA